MPDPAPKAIFLSYARDDAAAARRIAEALRSSGLEVWFDENELRGGDAWDRKIRQQINDCSLFVALISQRTEAREKGYFRLEWKLAVDQTAMLAEGVPFIAPVVIDDTRETGAVVPPEFLRVQWTRLPGALPTPQFVEQMQRLLHAPRKPVGATRAGYRAGSAGPFRRRHLPASAWLGMAIAVGIGAAITFFATRKASPPPESSRPVTISPAPAAAEKNAASVSEVSQLVAKARALYEPWDLASNEDFDLAEQLLKKATELDPADGEAWAAYSVLSSAFYVARTGETERTIAARSQAARAIKLAPNLDLARFAYALSLRFDPKTQDECLRLLREEAARQPGNRMVVRMLGTTLVALGQFEQALVYYDKAAALPGRDPVTLYNRAQALSRLNRYPETEVVIDEALALAPAYSNAHAMKISLLLDYHGDMAGARQHLERVPADFYSRDAGVVTAAMTWLYSREPQKCLEALRLARDYLRAAFYIGPKAYFSGVAQSMLGNTDAARTEWRAALRVVDKLLETQPNTVSLLENKTMLLARLGQTAEAENLLRELVQRAQHSNSLTFAVARIQCVLGRSDEALSTLASLTTSIGPWRNHLRYAPEWDSLRGNPRFQALLKATDPKKQP